MSDHSDRGPLEPPLVQLSEDDAALKGHAQKAKPRRWITALAWAFVLGTLSTIAGAQVYLPREAAHQIAAFSTHQDPNWRTVHSKDPLTDEEAVVFSLDADRGKSTFGEPIVMSVVCTAARISALVQWSTFLEAEPITLGSDPLYISHVTARFGNSRPREDSWIASDDRSATIVPDTTKFLSDLAGHDRLVLQTTPYNDAPITAVFDTANLEAVVLKNPMCSRQMRIAELPDTKGPLPPTPTRPAVSEISMGSNMGLVTIGDAQYSFTRSTPGVDLLMSECGVVPAPGKQRCRVVIRPEGGDVAEFISAEHP